MSLPQHFPHSSRSSRTFGTAASLLGALGLLLPSGSAGDPLPPPPAAACGSGAFSVGDAQINPPQGGDKDFFAVPAGPPTIMFVLGNNYRMQNYLVTLPNTGAATGCTDSSLTSGMSWFDLNSSDPARNGSVPYDPDPAFGRLQFFDPGQYYVSYGDRLPITPRPASAPPVRLPDDPPPYSLATNFQATYGDNSPEAACGRFFSKQGQDGHGNNDERDACAACLRSKGWYRGSASGPNYRWVLSGGVLNVNPPKFVMARKVVKDTVQAVTNARIGLAIYGPDQDNYDPALVVSPVQPGCDKSFPNLDQRALATARTNMIAQLNKVTFDNLELGMGEALFSLGGYFSSQQEDQKWSRWFANGSGNPVNAPPGYPGNSVAFNGHYYPWTDGPNTWVKGPAGSRPGVPWEGSGEQKSVCWACQNTAVLFITDAVPDFDNTVPTSQFLQLLVAAGARNPDSSLVTFNPNSATPGGINYCNKFGGTLAGCDLGFPPQGPDATNKNFADDVAFFLAHMDLRDDYNGNEGLDHGQRVRTYTIGFGVNDPFLKSVAAAGRGKFYFAADGGQLRDALLRAVSDVRQTATSFASANLTPVQAGGQQFSAYVPRFIPRNDRPFEGHLYRFQYYSEFVEGCDPVRAASPEGDPADLDKNGKCDGVFLLDTPDGYTLAPGALPATGAFTANNIVQEAGDGTWVKVRTAIVDPATGRLTGGQPAHPFWDANAALQTRSASAPCAGPGVSATGGRCLYTLIDRNNDGRFDDADNPPVEFIRANEPLLRPYLLAGGTAFCQDAFAKLGRSWTGSAQDRQACSETLIDFIRGVDVFDDDGDGNRTENRPCADDTTQSCMLGDIFHSAPIVVDPPVDPFLCDLGLHNQCLRTLYMDYAALGKPPVSEQVCAPGAPKPCYQATPMNPPLNLPKADYGAYGQYQAANGARDRFILVGTNDGLLHAFHAGSAIPLKTKQSAIDDIEDLGTGQEMWAFIPPDLLPKLGLLVNGHQYMVDGTPMVRDVWVDGSASGGAAGVKEAGEFHTLAILSERGGGNRYLALDVTDPWGMTRGGAARPFRWMFPQPLAPESAEVGESWQNFAPKPPPIGPVRLENTSNARGWDERWIVMLNGGYSADLTRGRGVYMLDVWTGARLWSFSADLTLGGLGDAFRDRVENLMMPVAATPALVDVGQANSAQHDADGFFDTAVVGDVGGQMWTFRFFQPGRLSGGVVSNWYGARSLEVNRQDVSGAGAVRDLSGRQPFFSLASNTLQPETGWLRTFAGTGDRQNLKQTEAAGCSPSNLLACSRLKCDVDLTVGTNVNGLSKSNHLKIQAGQLTLNTSVVPSGSTVSPAPTCTGAKLGIDSLTLSCPTGTSLATTAWAPPSISTRSECTNAAGSYSCTVSGTDMDARSDLAPKTDTLPWNRFYGFYSYGGTDRAFNDQTTALVFDARRATDKPFPCSASTGCGLTNVTLPSNQVFPPNYAFPKAGPTDPGWFVQYTSLDEKTGAGSAVLGGIVFWPTLQVQPGAAGPCNAPSGDTGRSWQADIITGAPDQAESFKVYNGSALVGYQQTRARTVTAPPPEPATVISLSKTGEVRYGISVVEPGAAPKQETLRSKTELAADVYWLEVPRSVHQCRHLDGNACK